MIYLGVDGGGTKTAFILINDTGEVLAQHESSTSYYIGNGIQSVRDIIQRGISEVCLRAAITPGDISYSFLGLPAYGEISTDISALDSIATPVLEPHRYTCDNDMICGWAASLGCRDGINIVSGTGSIAYGEHKGLKARCGGWGEIFSDEGSAYWIGRQSLNLFSRMADGRERKGLFYDLLREEHPFELDLDLCDLVFNKWKGDRSKIASVAVLAAHAASNGDKAAREIFFQAAKELAQLVDALREKLAYGPDEIVMTSYSGGVFNSGSTILEAFSFELSKLNGNYLLCEPTYPPNIGAAVYAAMKNGTPLSDAALKKLSMGMQL